MKFEHKRPTFLPYLGILFFLFTSSLTRAQSPDEFSSARVRLPNGWSLTPAGEHLPLGDLPLNIAVSPSKKLLAVTNNGQSDQSVMLIDAENNRLLDSMVMGKCWLGLAFGDEGETLYAAGGNDNWIVRFGIEKMKLVAKDTIVLGKPWPNRISPAGLALDDARHLLYVVTKDDNSLYVVDLVSKKVTGRFPLGAEGYTCLLSPGRSTLYISCWGCNKIQLFDTQKRQMSGSIPVGSHPNDLCLAPSGSHLFVANANDNSISVIDVQSRKVVETLNTALYPDAPNGSTPNSVALSKDGKTLYVANADNNCLGVFDVSRPGFSKSKGFIPTGWYPTSVRVANGKIYVANGKGLSSFANPDGPNPSRKNEKVVYQKGDLKKVKKEQYIGGLFRGTLGILPEPSPEQMAVFSQAAYQNTPYSKEKETVTEGEPGNPVPARTGDPSSIKYVFYVIKENRTYDQVLGDIPEGNGDTSLVLFGKNITPNQHALAKEFVLLDNFYVDGEVSADGHNWSTAAYATDYLEKNWVTSYGGRGGGYDAEGTREIANNKNGFIWNLAKKYGVSYRTYGEFADDYTPNIPVLEKHFCPYYTSWDESVRDTSRFYQWKQDFDSLLAIDRVPQLNTLRFINDHTQGLSRGKPTVFAHVADNDLAVGLFIEYLSHSPIWNETAIFIVEDDAQNGPDHVDAHRTTAYVAGGFVKRGFIDHTMYSTSSMLRTIELILGLPPMSQYDAAATPMWRCFTNEANLTPFTSRPCQVDLTEVNVAVNQYSRMSESFDFTMEDRAPDGAFNEVLWFAVKGSGSVCPPPVHAAFINTGMDAEDED